MDNGGEYIIHSLAKICKQAGIRHQTTFPYSPQQNGLAERMNKTITERATSMNHHMHVDQKWCVEAMNTAAYITNRLSSASHPDKTSFQICLGHRPNVEGMRVFRVFGNPHIDKYSRKKLEKKTFPCMFLAYSDDVKGYNVWILNANRLQLTRSAQFQESSKTKYIDVNDFDDDQDDPDTNILMPPVNHSVEPMNVNKVDPPEFSPNTMDDTDTLMIPASQQQAIVPRGRYHASSGCPPFRSLASDTQPHGDNSHTIVPYETSESIFH
uniref:Putative polyprotein n=1 Tax=Albugo laibachii Nc14 TaxID=890382 RepID=F0WT33_9STRA|nr:putative polyprotein [Albugo laibachii Nc14]|eukprot:CCA24520.1 putative polyprotein [Albugo laibachii Nc14]